MFFAPVTFCARIYLAKAKSAEIEEQSALYANAAQNLQSEIDRGNDPAEKAEAQYHLAKLVGQGHGVTADFSKAKTLLSNSASGGYILAKFELDGMHAESLKENPNPETIHTIV